MKKKHLFYIFLSFFLFSQKSNAQCPNNINFGNNNLSNWFWSLEYYGGATVANTTYPLHKYNGPPAGATTQTYQMERLSTNGTVSTTDTAIRIIPYTGTNIYDLTAPANTLKVVPNINGYQYSYSVKLGNKVTQNKVRKISYSIDVPIGVTNYNITYAYALVLQDGTHPWDQQPRFIATVRNPSLAKGKDTIKCASVIYAVPTSFTEAQKNTNGFYLTGVNSGIYYKNWTEVSFNLGAYAGKTILLEFESDDCSPSGHWGYAYFALRNDGCGSGSITGNSIICSTSTQTYTTPSINGATYTWSIPAGWTGSSTSNSITVTPTANSSGYVTATPSQSCGNVATSSIYISYGAAPSTPGDIDGPTTICSSGSSGSNNVTYSIAPVDNATNYTWTIPAGWTINSGGNGTTSVVVTIPSGQTGNKIISVTASNGCATSSSSSSTLAVQVTAPSNGGTTRVSAGNATQCNGGSDVTLSVSGTAGTIQLWQNSTDGAKTWNDIPSSSSSTYTVASPTQSALYRIVVKNGSCASAYSTTTAVSITSTPQIILQPSNTGICTSATATLTLGAQSTENITYQWYRRTSPSGSWAAITASNIPNDAVTYSNFTTTALTITSAPVGINNYQYYAVVSGATCGSVNSNVATLTVSTAAASVTTQPETKSVCKGSTVTLTTEMTGSNISFQWYSNASNSNTGGTLISGETNNAYTFTSSGSGATYYYCIGSSTCASTTVRATTNATAVNITAGNSVSASIAVASNTVCSSELTTFTATPTNGGSSPTYVWTKNNISVGSNSDTYSDANLSTGDIIGLNLISNIACAVGSPATALPITMTVKNTPTITATTSNSRCDAGTVTLGGSASAGSVNWYSSLTGGSSLYTGTSYTTASISANTTYYADATNNGCTSPARISVLATVYTTPIILSTTPSARCATGTVNLSATASAGTINWYTVSSGGSSVNSTNNYTTPSISSSTTYFVDAIQNGCTTVTRSAIIATVNSIPSAPSGTSAQSFCTGNSPTVNDLIAAGSYLLWYTSSTGGTNLSNTESLVNSTHYYASQIISGCESTNRFDVTATINTTPTVSSTTPNSRCGSGIISLDAAPSAGDINWYSNSSGGSSLYTGNSYNTSSISITTNYYVDATNNGCTTNSRTLVVAAIKTIPNAPTGTASQTFCSGINPAISDLNATGSSILWYAGSSGGASLSNSVSLANSTHYYASQTVNGCESNDRFDVTSTINTTPTITSTTTGSRCEIGVISLSASASGGVINWYSNATGGSTLNTGSNYTTPSLNSNTIYYVDATQNSCTTTIRTAILATVIRPTILTTTSAQTCTPRSLTLQATTISGATINWYSVSTGGSLITTGNSYSTPTINNTTTYYVDATYSGCTTTSRTQIDASYNSVLTVDVSGNATDYDQVILTASGGSSYLWNGGSSPTNASNTFKRSGYYSVTASDAFGCTGSKVVYVQLKLWGVTKKGEVSDDSVKQVNFIGKIASYNPVTRFGKRGTYGKDGSSAASAGISAYQIKQDYPNSTDGLYWIQNDNINNGIPFQIYADMTTDGGGWTLILCNKSSNEGWTSAQAVLRNQLSPTINPSNGSNDSYSIIAWADYIKKSSTGFQYMFEAGTRGTYGGIFTANQAYSFVCRNNSQTDITVNTKFGPTDWTQYTFLYEGGGFGPRMPWWTTNSSEGLITTSTSGNGWWWGTLVTSSGWNPSPWLSGERVDIPYYPSPGIIWYWVR